MRRLTQDEARDLVWYSWGQEPDSQSNGITEAFIPDCSVADAIETVEMFIPTIAGDIEEDSYEVHPDTSEISDVPVARVVIKTVVT